MSTDRTCPAQQHPTHTINDESLWRVAMRPEMAHGQMELNCLLVARPTPLIDYDVTLAPQTGLANTFHTNWPFEPATNPPVSAMTITAPTMIPWPVVVHASARNPTTITIVDVLSEVHNAFCRSAGLEEHPPSIPLAAQYIPGGVPRWAGSGMAGVDTVNGRVKWAGLSEGMDEFGTWNLTLKRE